MFEYCTHPLSMGQITERYLKATGKAIPERNNSVQSYNEQIKGDVKRMENETLNLQLSLQWYKGDELTSAQYEELEVLEQQLELSVTKIRARKNELLQQQLDNLKKTENLLEKENQEMYYWLISNQIQKQEAEVEQNHHQAMTELKLVGAAACHT